MENVKNKKSYQFAIIFVLIGLILLISATYAWLAFSINGTKNNDIVVGNLSVKIGESLNDGIQLEDAIPITDEDGKKQKGYTFSVTNNGNITSNYVIYLDDMDIPSNEVRMKDELLKYQLMKNHTMMEPELLTATYDSNNSRILDQGTLDAGDTNEYELKVWISDTADNEVMSTLFRTNIRVDAEQIKE